jgi:hypothetical protein
MKVRTVFDAQNTNIQSVGECFRLSTGENTKRMENRQFFKVAELKQGDFTP